MKIEYLEETSSTSDYIKRYLMSGEDRIVCARRQTGGKGTKGRSFLSREGGVYLSALTFHRDLPEKRAFSVMAHAAVAVCRTAAFFGAFPEIKWPNDVFASGKKLCGILTENTLGGGKVVCSVVGIGLNVTNDLSGLEEIAVTLRDCALGPVSAEEAREKLIEEYLAKSSFEEYLSFVRFLGKEICVIEGERRYNAIAKRILPDGRLEAEADGETKALSAAEISVRWRE